MRSTSTCVCVLLCVLAPTSGLLCPQSICMQANRILVESLTARRAPGRRALRMPAWYGSFWGVLTAADNTRRALSGLDSVGGQHHRDREDKARLAADFKATHKDLDGFLSLEETLAFDGPAF